MLAGNLFPVVVGEDTDKGHPQQVRTSPIACVLTGNLFSCR